MTSLAPPIAPAAARRRDGRRWSCSRRARAEVRAPARWPSTLTRATAHRSGRRSPCARPWRWSRPRAARCSITRSIPPCAATGPTNWRRRSRPSPPLMAPRRSPSSPRPFPRRDASPGTAGVVIVWVGSAGLMRQLAPRLPHKGRPRPPQLEAVRGPILFVVGSAAPASLMQFEALAAAPDLTSLRLAAGDLQAPQWSDRIAVRLADALGRGQDTALLLAPAAAGPEPLDPDLVARLAQLIGPWLDRASALVATGGETARRLLEVAQIWGISLAGEVEAGVPLGIGLGQRSLPIVTKAGAFGDRHTLVRCRAALRERAREPSSP